MDRAERRRRNRVKSARHLKKYWSRFGMNRVFDRQTQEFIYVSTVNDAIKVKDDTNGRLLGWLNGVKKGNSCHHSDIWDYYECKRIDNKKKREAKKQMDIEVQNALINRDSYEWENYCGACDNFPGDDFNEPSKFSFHECPRKGKINANTCWKNFNCPYFWD